MQQSFYFALTVYVTSEVLVGGAVLPLSWSDQEGMSAIEELLQKAHEIIRQPVSTLCQVIVRKCIIKVGINWIWGIVTLYR